MNSTDKIGSRGVSLHTHRPDRPLKGTGDGSSCVCECEHMTTDFFIDMKKKKDVTVTLSHPAIGDVQACAS